jgi:hypothetical protein
MDSITRQSGLSKGFSRRFLLPKMRQPGSTERCTEGRDHRTCAELASQCEISHYEVFMRAHRWYHGCDFSTIDGDFKVYLLSGCDDVPHYVRQYAREWQPGLFSA